LLGGILAVLALALSGCGGSSVSEDDATELFSSYIATTNTQCVAASEDRHFICKFRLDEIDTPATAEVVVSEDAEKVVVVDCKPLGTVEESYLGVEDPCSELP